MIYGSFASFVLNHPLWWFPWSSLVVVVTVIVVVIAPPLRCGAVCSTPPGWPRTAPCLATPSGPPTPVDQVRQTINSNIIPQDLLSPGLLEDKRLWIEQKVWMTFDFATNKVVDIVVESSCGRLLDLPPEFISSSPKPNSLEFN